MDYETVLYETDAGKARITLNRPEKLNAISWQMHQELRDAFAAADRDPAVHVAVLRGAGRAFSAGYDITPPPGELTHAASGHSMERDIWFLEQAQQMRMAIWDMHKPVIGQVHGYCLAGGTDLVFLCDVVIAAEDAVIGFPPVRSMGSPVGHMWTYLAGPQWAKRLLLTGDSVSGNSNSACHSPKRSHAWSIGPMLGTCTVGCFGIGGLLPNGGGPEIRSTSIAGIHSTTR